MRCFVDQLVATPGVGSRGFHAPVGAASLQRPVWFQLWKRQVLLRLQLDSHTSQMPSISCPDQARILKKEVLRIFLSRDFHAKMRRGHPLMIWVPCRDKFQVSEVEERWNIRLYHTVPSNRTKSSYFLIIKH
jgi:hypothetical protein